MAKVGIVMGSDSDMPVMSKAAALFLHTENQMYSLNMRRAQRRKDLK